MIKQALTYTKLALRFAKGICGIRKKGYGLIRWLFFVEMFGGVAKIM